MMNVNKMILLALCASLSAATIACSNNDNNANNQDDIVDATTDARDDGTEDDATKDEEGDQQKDEEEDETSGATALVQIMHVAPDVPTAVDVYVNGELVVDDLSYKTATKFFAVPAGTDLTVELRGSTEPASEAAAYTENLGSLAAGSNYIVAAAGSIGPGATNPLDLVVISGARTEGTAADQTSVLAFHASPDAPAVDLVINNAAEAQLKGVEFGDFAADSSGLASYVPLASNGGYLDGFTTVGVFAGSDHVRSFNSGPLTPGAAVTVVATGLAANFLDDDATNDDKALGLTAFFAEKGDATERATSADLAVAARVQVIHNSPEPAANLVDVFVGDQKLLDDFAFRVATPFITVPAVELNFKISGSADDTDTPLVATLVRTETLVADRAYIIAAHGALSTSFSGNAADVEGAPKIHVFNAEEASLKPASSKRVKVIHGIPDIPFPIKARAVAGLVSLPLTTDEIQYPQSTFYGEIPALAASATVTVEVFYDAGEGEVVFTTPPVDLSTLDAVPHAVIASGFLDEEQYGPTTAPALLILAPSGDVTILPLTPKIGPL